MKTARKMMIIFVVVASVVFIGATTRADWIPEDGHKMHFPQMPDLNGWDVAFSTNLADDWKCSETGPVEDIHFWISWQADDVRLEDIGQINVLIHEDDRSGAFSKPVEPPLWGIFLPPTQFTIQPYEQGNQGWYDPFAVPPVVVPGDHQQVYQVNISNIPRPFIQEQGQIYWLDLEVVDLQGEPMSIGWKTSLDHFEDDAVYWDGQDWVELRDPLTEESLDLAFVITPEPATLAVLALAVIPALLKRWGSA